jgi:hypothetical protein
MRFARVRWGIVNRSIIVTGPHTYIQFSKADNDNGWWRR